MKDPVSDWFGVLPGHWQFRKLKFAVMLVTKRPLPNTDEANRIALENVESWSGKFVASDSEYEGEGIEFQNNDLLFGKLRPYLAKVYLATKAGLAIGDFYVLRCSKDITHTFLAHLLRSKSCINIIDSSTYGAKMPRASWEFMGNLPIPLPPLNEQHAIAAFLDYKTAQIDSLIDKKRRMIELLKEKRTALISHAVTKGLNPDAPMKDSGVPWLGQVPAHWEVKKVAWLMDINSGEALPNELIEREPDESNSIPVYGGNGIMGYTGQANVFKQKLIIGRVGAHCGNVHLSQRIGWITDNALVATVRSEAILDYLFGALKVLDLNRLAARNAQPLITGSLLKQQYIPIPPKSEQQSIVEYVNRKSAEMTGLHEKTAQAIDSLKEYRAAMITAAVTGQIDVRNHGAA
ncbi:MAG: restriction endonuclease subunit S [Turneriella sp.]|nr:restriction endonuclease subunit S [Turneriella sp.]